MLSLTYIKIIPEQFTAKAHPAAYLRGGQEGIFIRKVAISKPLTDLSRNRFVDSSNIDRR